MSRLGIVGVPLDLGGGRRGVDMGPSAVRIAGIGERLAALGHEVHDYGDIDTPIQETTHAGDPRQHYLGEIARVCQALHDRSREVLATAASRSCSAAITASAPARSPRRRASRAATGGRSA